MFRYLKKKLIQKPWWMIRSWARDAAKLFSWTRRRRKRPRLLFRTFQEWLVRLPMRMLRGLFRWLRKGFSAVVFVFIGSTRLFAYWWRQRNYRHLLWGLPGLLVMLGSGLVVAAHYVSDRDAIIGSYLTSARDAAEHENYEHAALCFARLVDVGWEDDELLFQMALTAQKLEQYEQVETILGQLAPERSARYYRAHLWKAQRVLASIDPPAKNLARCETHLNHAIRLKRDYLPARKMLGELLRRQGRYKQAIDQYRMIAQVDRNALLDLASCYVFSGDKETGLQWAQTAYVHFKSNVALDPGDTVSMRQMASAAVFLGRYAEAVQHLDDVMSMDDSLAVRAEASRALLAWVDSLKADDDASWQLKLNLIERTLRLNPSEVNCYDRLMKLLIESPRRDQVSEILEKLVADGDAGAIAHLLIGTHAGERGQFDKAKLHLELAQKMMPQAPLVANNLAWYLATKPEPELEIAKRLIVPVLRQWPLRPEVHDTNGEIHFKLKKHQEAAVAFERVLQLTKEKHTLRTRVHNRLALVYKELGDPQLAERHAKLATEASSEKNDKSP